jgi:hypothetical protein
MHSKPPTSGKKSESKLKKFEKSSAKNKACQNHTTLNAIDIDMKIEFDEEDQDQEENNDELRNIAVPRAERESKSMCSNRVSIDCSLYSSDQKSMMSSANNSMFIGASKPKFNAQYLSAKDDNLSLIQNRNLSQAA